MDLNKLLKTQWDRSAAIGCTVLGAIFLLVGWIGVSGTAYLAEQSPYIVSGGIGGVFLLGLGATLWISADLRDEWRKLDRIERALGDGTLRWVEDATAVPAPRTTPAAVPVAAMATQAADVAADVVADVVADADPAPARSSSKAAATARTPAVTATRTARRPAAPKRTSRAAHSVSTDA